MVAWTSNTFSSLPEVVNPPRTDRSSAYGKQVAGGEEKQTSEPYVHKESVWIHNPNEQQHEQGGADIHSKANDEEGLQRKRRRKTLIWGCSVISILILLGIGLGVGVTMGLQSDESSHAASNRTRLSDSPASRPNDTSSAPSGSKGAVERSGLAACVLKSQLHLAWPTQLQTNQSNLLLFFQHSSGEIRVLQNKIPEGWTGGSSKDIIADDAKQGTPIAIRCPGGAGDVAGLHVFYINKENLLRQRSITNLTYVWSDGPLNDLKVRALDSAHVGLTAGFYAGPIGDVNLEGTKPYSGMRVLVGTGDTTFNQYSWRPGLTQWHYDQNWEDMNGEAAPAMFAWGRGQTTYINFIDQKNDVATYWMDTAMKKASTDAHRINVWTKSSINIPNLDSSAGLSYHGNLFGRVADSGKIQGWNMTYEAENSTIGSTTLSEVAGPPGSPDTRVAAMTYPPAGRYDTIFVFYQANGNEIVMSTGDVASGAWNSTTLPVPDL
ncbi:uncharacterized protein LTR77_004624 [Saxophila tyrrhenica]|uniref:Fucose-specific lectin n=1 Tax=Saxophila tyrrhenica TaxID=1690608 RepID=A0AAV9PDE6_9PEZI|nr:hypothetical protein LTR77_004624 [Saxophila tyrrhenica]